jgi:glutathionylspermidine synthase
MNYHTVDGKEYWNESAYYEFDAASIDKIEDATNELHSMCIQYVTQAIVQGNYDGYDFDEQTIRMIEQSWKNLHPYIYGRFDLGINRNGDIKMFEYNADTPTSLLEASVIQWQWKEYWNKSYDQFNSIHENLVQKFHNLCYPKIYFTTMSDAPYEDWGNLHYLLACAVEAGIDASSIDLEQVGWDGSSFVDVNNKPIDALFKLYPWEWLVKDEFANNIMSSRTLFIEPAWKMLLSNKLLCVKLWEMFPNHPLLLESYSGEANVNMPNRAWISKPKLGREGQGITMGPNANKHNVIQERFDVVSFDGIQPVIGSWVVDDVACGIGIREDKGITTNNSQFVPHYFK